MPPKKVVKERVVRWRKEGEGEEEMAGEEGAERSARPWWGRPIVGGNASSIAFGLCGGADRTGTSQGSGFDSAGRDSDGMQRRRLL